jgi:hypothetical protein
MRTQAWRYRVRLDLYKEQQPVVGKPVGYSSLAQLHHRGPTYPRPGKVPHFLFGPFSFVNNGLQCCVPSGPLAALEEAIQRTAPHA